MKRQWIAYGIGMMVALGVVSTAQAAGGWKEGKWSMEVTVKMDPNSKEAQEMKQAMEEMKNMPPEQRAMMERMQGSMGMKMGMDAGGGMTTSITQCLTGESPVPEMQASNGRTPKNCQETHDIKGNTVTFQQTCKERGVETEIKGSMTYSGDSMKGQTVMRETRRGKTTETTTEMSGKYLGPCK